MNIQKKLYLIPLFWCIGMTLGFGIMIVIDKYEIDKTVSKAYSNTVSSLQKTYCDKFHKEYNEKGEEVIKINVKVDWETGRIMQNKNMHFCSKF